MHIYESIGFITMNKDAVDGLEILKTIRKHTTNVRVIMLSSQEKYGVALTTVMKEAEQYVIKDEEAFEKISKLIE